MQINKIYQGNSLEVLKKFDNNFIDCIVTSPPYWNLRDYGIENQIGLEKDYNEYISNLINIFSECKRVLKDTGSLWVNIGDTYATQSGSMGTKHWNQPINNKAKEVFNFKQSKPKNIKHKSLIGIPFLFANAMLNEGWILRNTIIWQKPNSMPEPVKDRFTVDFEYLFFFVKKSKDYFFERQFEKPTFESLGRNKRAVWNINTKPFSESHFAVFPEELVETILKSSCPEKICKKCNLPIKKIYESDWKDKRKGTWKDAENLGKKMARTDSHKQALSGGLKNIKDNSIIKFKGYSICNCNKGFNKGLVCDPFFGAGTVGVVAKKFNLNYIGIELKKEYIDISTKRINSVKEVLF